MLIWLKSPKSSTYYKITIKYHQSAMTIYTF